MSERIEAPFTRAQAARLNEWQRAGTVHEFTCNTPGCSVRTLNATISGWVCGGCGYRQLWAHAFMLEAPPKPLSWTKEKGESA